jgi:predicted CopG family antitoxin
VASRNVSLRMEAYDALDDARRSGESFSDAVLRVVKDRPKVAEIMASFEPLDRETSREFDKQVRRARRDIERSMRGRFS